MNKAIVLIDLMLKELGFEKYYELADYFGVTAASLSGWVNRNSTKAALKHAAKKGMDSALLEKKLAEIVAQGEQAIESGAIDPKKEKEEPQKFSDRFKKHSLDNPPAKTFDKVQKLLELQNQHAPYSSPYSTLFQILFGLSKDDILRILSEKLEVENVSDEEKIRFIEDFEALLQHIVSSQAKLEILDRVRKKVLK